MKEACVSNIPFLSLKRAAYPCTESQQLYNCLEIEARQLQSLTTVQKEVMAGEKCVFLTTLVYPGPQIFFLCVWVLVVLFTARVLWSLWCCLSILSGFSRLLCDY